MDFFNNNFKAFYNYLKELFLIFKHILSHFEKLEKQVKASDFNGHLGIARLINEA